MSMRPVEVLLLLVLSTCIPSTVRGFEGDVRLVGGRDDYSGRLEISHRGEWGTVCGRGFDERAAQVVCRQLRLDGGRVRERAYYGEGRGEIWMSELSCSGNEDYLDQCRFDGWGNINCRHGDDVGVECRRAGSSSSSSSGGSNHGGSAGGSDQGGYNQGGYNQGGSAGGYNQGSSSGGYNQGSNQGGSTSGGSSGRPREGDLQLVNGGYVNEGRLEVYHNGEWGTVCDDRFGSEEAKVACKQMGFHGGIAKTRGYYGYGRGRIWLDNVSCRVTDRRLEECQRNNWGETDCSHGEDVGLLCFR